MKDTIRNLLMQFMGTLIDVEVYNEISLQLELGIFLRNRLPDYKVLFEKNIYALTGTKKSSTPLYEKSEIDIVLESKACPQRERYAIELKYPVNGQYPEEMFEFLKDIKFMEQVRSQAKFSATFTLTLVDDRCFFEGSHGIHEFPHPYEIFRRPDISVGPGYDVYKPTGSSKGEKKFTIVGHYNSSWTRTVHVVDNQETESRYYIFDF